MSWAEVKKVNSNMKTPLNTQIANAMYQTAFLITTTQTWVVPKTGLYKIICVGAGGSGGNYSTQTGTGGAGGVAIKNIQLTQGDSYNLTVGSTASFSNICSATSGGGNSWTGGTGGIATGGDTNYTGNNGNTINAYTTVLGASVGCFIQSLSNFYTDSRIYSTFTATMRSGYGLLGLGQSGGAVNLTSNTGALFFQTSGGAGIIIQMIEEG